MGRRLESEKVKRSMKTLCKGAAALSWRGKLWRPGGLFQSAFLHDKGLWKSFSLQEHHSRVTGWFQAFLFSALSSKPKITLFGAFIFCLFWFS